MDRRTLGVPVWWAKPKAASGFWLGLNPNWHPTEQDFQSYTEVNQKQLGQLYPKIPCWSPKNEDSIHYTEMLKMTERPISIQILSLLLRIISGTQRRIRTINVTYKYLIFMILSQFVNWCKSHQLFSLSSTANSKSFFFILPNKIF